MTRAAVLQTSDLGSVLNEPESYSLPAFTELTYTTRYWGGDSFLMEVGGDADGASALVKGKLLWLPDEANRVFLIDRVITTRSGPSRVNANLVVVGRSVDTFMGKERVVIPEGDFDSQAAVPAETAMKHYVNLHAGPGAAANRQIPFLTIATDLARGSNVTLDARYKTLGDVLLHIGLQAGLGWATRLDPTTGLLVFDILTGIDNSSTVLLDFDLKAVLSWEDTDDMMEAPTVAVVGGQGALSARDVETRHQGDDPTGLARREAFVDAVDVASGDTAALDARGDTFLASNALTRLNLATLAQDGVFQPEVDFNLGDMVRIADDAQTATVALTIGDSFDRANTGYGGLGTADCGYPWSGSADSEITSNQWHVEGSDESNWSDTLTGSIPFPVAASFAMVLAPQGPFQTSFKVNGTAISALTEITYSSYGGPGYAPGSTRLYVSLADGVNTIVASAYFTLVNLNGAGPVLITMTADTLSLTVEGHTVTANRTAATPSPIAVMTDAKNWTWAGSSTSTDVKVDTLVLGTTIVDGTMDSTERIVAWDKTYEQSAAAPVIVLQIGKPFPATKFTKAAPGVAVRDLVIPAAAHPINLEAPTGTIDGVNAAFTLVQGAPAADTAVMLFKNGILQQPGAGNDFTLAGAVVTFEVGNLPQTGDILLAT